MRPFRTASVFFVFQRRVCAERRMNILIVTLRRGPSRTITHRARQSAVGHSVLSISCIVNN